MNASGASLARRLLCRALTVSDSTSRSRDISSALDRDTPANALLRGPLYRASPKSTLVLGKLAPCALLRNQQSNMTEHR